MTPNPSPAPAAQDEQQLRAELRAELEKWKRRYEEKEKPALILGRELETARAELSSLRQQLAEAKEEVEDRTADMHAIARERDNVVAQLSAAKADTEKLGAELEGENVKMRELFSVAREFDLANDSIVAACNCSTKTPEVQYHKPGCKYRLIMERDTATARVAELETENAALLGVVKDCVSIIDELHAESVPDSARNALAVEKPL